MAQSDSLEYCPMATDGSTWVIFDNEGFYSPIGYSGSYVVRIEGDSLHDNLMYKKMWVANLIHEFDARPSDIESPYEIDSLKLYGLVRDDSINRQFLGIVPTYQDYENQSEVLIHDFGIDIGQDMVGIHKWDTVSLNDIIIGTFFGKVRLAQVPTRTEMITIEGIGTVTTGPLCQNPTLAINSGYRSIIDYCVGSIEDCDLIYQTTSLNFISESDTNFEIYPNPILKGNSLIVDIKSASSGLLNFINVDGRISRTEIVFSGENVINLQNMQPGLYLLSYEGKLKKLIIR